MDDESATELEIEGDVVVTEEEIKVEEEVKPSVQCSVYATKPSAKAHDARESNTLQQQKQSKKQKVNQGATKQETHQQGKNQGTETVDKLTKLFRFMDLEDDEESQPGKDDDAFEPHDGDVSEAPDLLDDEFCALETPT